MNSKNNYNINLDTKFGYSQLIDIPDMVAVCKRKVVQPDFVPGQ